MDYDLYYEKARNHYTVHFANTKALEEDKIKHIFSQFGNVISVNTAGDIRGLRFIKYATLRETINCIKGLQDNVLVKLLPERSKINNGEVKSDSSGKKNNHKNRRNDKDKQLPADVPNKNDNSRNRFDDSRSNMDRGLKKQEFGQSNQSLDEILNGNVSMNTKRQIDRKVARWNKRSVDVDFGNGESAGEYSEISKISNLIAKSRTTNEPEFQNIFGAPSRNVNSSTYSKKSFQKPKKENNIEIPNLVSIGTSVCSGSTKSLDQISSTSHSVIEPKIVLAQHVIVANVHKDFGIHYILHLFEKYDPIAISLMKTVPQTFIRYCHVYFKKSNQALEIEKKFDRFPLSGKSLIVLRSHRLTEEA